MLKRMLLCILLAVCLVSAAQADGLTTSTYTESPEAFANPMKGFCPARAIGSQTFPQGEYATVSKHYIKYTDLEMYPTDTAQKMIDWSNKEWAGIEERNLKVIPRVVIVYPNGPDGGDDGYWAEGLDHSDFADRWVNETFQTRIAAFIMKLGEAWDNDPRVAAIEMGIWGKWGEHHVYPLALKGTGSIIPPVMQKVMGDAFAKAFPHKQIMVRNAERFRGYNVGFYWDSFALRDDRTSGLLIMERDVWRTQMMGGEIAYDWGDLRPIGWNPDETLAKDECTDYVIEWIQKIHTSHLGWVANYTQGDPTLSENAARMQKALGYRYVIEQAAYPETVQPGESLSLTFDVANVGNAPFYYMWPVELSLLNKQREPVWKDVIHVDIRKWLPGQTYTVSDTFELPQDLKPGTYTLALAVLDPSGNVPSLRFANTNYYKGGRTPLGVIGIGEAAQTTEIGPFDSLYSDHSLYYTLEGDHNPPIEDTQVYADVNP